MLMMYVRKQKKAKPYEYACIVRKKNIHTVTFFLQGPIFKHLHFFITVCNDNLNIQILQNYVFIKNLECMQGKLFIKLSDKNYQKILLIRNIMPHTQTSASKLPDLRLQWHQKKGAHSFVVCGILGLLKKPLDSSIQLRIFNVLV